MNMPRSCRGRYTQSMHLVIFESSLWQAFAPLSLTRPVFCLQSGMGTLLQRQIRRLKPSRLSLWVRPALADYCLDRIAPMMPMPVAVNRPLDEHPAILLEAATTRPTLPASLDGPYVERSPHGQVGFTFLSSPGLSHEDVLANSQRWQDLTAMATHECKQACAGQLADLLHENESLLASDFADLEAGYRVLPEGRYHAVSWESIRIGAGVDVGPNAVLDASAGPIVIDAGAKIGANSVIEGPCYIGPRVLVQPLSLVRAGNTIGANCRIGGELGFSIIQGNSNKPHSGYMGHTYLGEWVNIGADTNTSNLKNTYGPISIRVGNREVPTGRMFMGSVIGDYTKTAIGTRLMSGSYLGVSSMIAVSGHAPRFVGSFQFLTDDKREQYDFRKAVEVATRVFARRNRQWTGLDETVLLYAKEAAESCEAPHEMAVGV